MQLIGEDDYNPNSPIPSHFTQVMWSLEFYSGRRTDIQLIPGCLEVDH